MDIPWAGRMRGRVALGEKLSFWRLFRFATGPWGSLVSVFFSKEVLDIIGLSPTILLPSCKVFMTWGTLGSYFGSKGRAGCLSGPPRQGRLQETWIEMGQGPGSTVDRRLP